MIIGIGETVLDIIFKDDVPQTAIPGGSTFNAIISIGRTKTPCTIITQTGDDHVGDITCKYLRDNGVDDSFVSRPKGIKSHISLAFLNEQNDAQYQFYKDHASDTIRGDCPVFTDKDIVLFGSFFAINPVIRPQVRKMLTSAHDRGSFLYYDINFRASHIADIPMVKDNIIENMRLSSVVRGSLEDFGYLYGTTNVDDIYREHIRPYCPYFICTNGGESIELRTPHTCDDSVEVLSTSIPVEKIQTVSTVGAGDNFNAGFLYGIIKQALPFDRSQWTHDEWQSLIAQAQVFSHDVCQQMGNSISPELVTLLLSQA